MKHIKTGSLLFVLIVIFLIKPLYSYAEKQKLPRAYGPIYLGMSIEEFKKAVNKDPRDGWCATCAEGELLIELLISKEKGKKFNLLEAITFPDANITYQLPALQPEFVECRFYKDKLYFIHMDGVKEIPEVVKNRYSKTLGKPLSDNAYSNGLSELVWKDDRTKLSVGYSTDSKETIDDISIDYTDLKIAAQVPPREMPDEK